MKRTILPITMLLMPLVSVWGQSEEPSYKRHYSQQSDGVIEKTRTTAAKTTAKVNDFLTTKESKAGLVKVKGNYYMPLYDTNLYHGDKSSNFRNECRRLFARRYPQAAIMSVACPQTGWVKEEILNGKQVMGYVQTMYCHIIAKDGETGFINARFSYRCYKDVEAQAYTPLTDNWPKWERVDYISQTVYAKLKEK